MVTQHIVYYTKDNTPTTRRTKQAHLMDVLGNESFKRHSSQAQAICWGVQDSGRLKCVTKSRDAAREMRRSKFQTGRVVALG